MYPHYQILKLGGGLKTSLVFITVLFLHFPYAASHSAIDTLRNPVPGADDFPRIVDSTYYTFQEMPFDVLEFRVLNQVLNETRRSQTFTFPIFVDDVPEGVEELQLTLSLRPDIQLPEGAVNVTPAVATVRIHDLSSKFIEQFCHGFSTNKAVFKKTDGEYTTRDRGQRKFAADIPRAKGEAYIYCKLPMTEVKGSMIRHIHHLGPLRLRNTRVCNLKIACACTPDSK